jgi:gamma-glutamylcyclotransferase (GGCT)/AIG2-like uncharacterized protein YtfP
MPDKKPFNLFVYGTLMNPSVFRAVLGYRLAHVTGEADGIETVLAREAVLTGYKKISPDNTYLYAVPDPLGRIRGYLVGPLPPQSLQALRHYEGRNYSRRTLSVQTGRGRHKALVFVANLRQLQHSFGYAFSDPFKQRILLQEKIDKALVEAQREQLHSTEPLGRRVVAELHGSTIRDLVRRHFEAGGISDYVIRRSLKDAPLADFVHLRDQQEANALADNYLGLVVRQVLFNQLEDRIQQEFRYELDHLGHSTNYYERTISSLAALQLLNESSPLVDSLVADCVKELDFSRSHLADYVRWAIVAADAIYSPAAARRQILLIGSHMGHAGIPLGAELEFSNIGHTVIRDPQGSQVRDSQFDGFLYFGDFGLDNLTWKLGGHVDDHHEKASHRSRRGFFELAIGNVSIEANLSKPITDDPWLLNQIIQEVQRFYRVGPHSVHISMQLRSQHRPSKDRMLPIDIMKCLLAIAGDPRIDADGRLRIARLHNREIVRTEAPASMLFSDVSVRRSSDEEDGYPDVRHRGSSARYVQQFKFLRLSPQLNYEPIILALKGVQLSLAPGNFLTPSQHQASRKHRRLFEELLEWGSNPTAMDSQAVEAFLGAVHEGLMAEKRGRPAHGEAYIAWALSELRRMIRGYNTLAAAHRPSPEPAPLPRS